MPYPVVVNHVHLLGSEVVLDGGTAGAPVAVDVDPLVLFLFEVTARCVAGVLAVSAFCLLALGGIHYACLKSTN